MSPHDCVGTNHLRARAARPRHARRAASERGDERDLDRRSRPLQLRGHLQRRPPAASRWCARAACGGRLDWETALARSPSGSADRASSTAARSSARSLRRPRRSRSCICWREARARPRQRAISIIACAARISATRRAIRSIRRSAVRSRSWRQRDARARRRLEPAQGGAAARAPPAQGGAARRAEFVRQSRALRVPVPGRALPRGERRSTCSGTWRRSSRGRRARAAARARRQSIAALSRARSPTDAHACDRAAALRRARAALILLGALAQRDPAFADLRARRGRACGAHGRDARLSAARAATRSARASPACCRIARPGGRAVAAGRLERRGHVRRAAARATSCSARSSRQHDIASPAALEALKARGVRRRAVAVCEHGEGRYAHVILPIGTFAETSGTYVNLEGRWQSVPGAATPVGEARPAWKVLRVLGNLLEPAGLRLRELGADHARSCASARRATPAFALQGVGAHAAVEARAGARGGCASSTCRSIAVDAIVRRSQRAAGDARRRARIARASA